MMMQVMMHATMNFLFKTIPKEVGANDYANDG
jgi:hypothetical protein